MTVPDYRATRTVTSGSPHLNLFTTAPRRDISAKDYLNKKILLRVSGPTPRKEN